MVEKMVEKNGDDWMRWVLFLLCAIAVAYGIFRATPPPQLFQHSDKVGHFLAFCGLSLTARWAFVSVPWYFFWPVLFGLAPLLEYLQGLLRPLRVYSLEDSYANMFGVAIALLITLLLKTSVLCRNR